MGEGHRCHECTRADCPGRLAFGLANRISRRDHLHQHGPHFALGGDAKIDAGAAAILSPGAPLYLYGPYKREEFKTAPSNQAFDRSLRNPNPNWGLRDLEAVAATAQSLGSSAPVITEMPANNLSAVFRHSDRVVAWMIGQRTVAFEIHTGRVASLSACHGSPAAMIVCQKSAARNATTIIRMIRPRVSRSKVLSWEVSRSGSLMRNYSVARQRANLTRH